jgi:hypothetical protein
MPIIPSPLKLLTPAPFRSRRWPLSVVSSPCAHHISPQKQEIEAQVQRGAATLMPLGRQRSSKRDIYSAILLLVE